MDLVNPYIAGNPIAHEEGFFGREPLLRAVQSMLDHPHANAIVLHGQRRMGKTSILLQLRRSLRLGGKFTPIYLDLQDKADKPLEELLLLLAKEIAEALNVEPPDQEHFHDDGTYFRREFLPRISATTPLVLLFDEFDVLDNVARDASQSFFPYLRLWMSNIKDVNFVFVLGRRPEDLSTETLSTFKGVLASRVSLLEKVDAEAVVRQSEDKEGPEWTDSAVERVWEICQGHPYFTQLLASAAWDAWYKLRGAKAQDQDPIEPGLVDTSMPQAFQQGSHSFLWIWNGLPPAEKVVLSAIAQAKGELVSQEDLVDILNNSGVRLVIRELEVAPENLADWGILINIDESYGFSVPIFRHWLASSFPLRRVKDELDRINPLANDLFSAGKRYYQIKQLDEAKSKLNESLHINPNHFGALLLLGNILLEERDFPSAVAALEEAFKASYTARPDFVRALLASADDVDEEERVGIYRRILAIEPSQRIALERLATIQEEQRQKKIKELEDSAVLSESEENWERAIEYYYSLRQIAPDHPGLEMKITEVEGQVSLLVDYRDALEALEIKDNERATILLADVIAKEPTYKEAARWLLLATKGVDVTQIEADSRFLATELRGSEKTIKMLESQQEDLNRLRRELTAERSRLQATEARLGALATQSNSEFMARFRQIFDSGDPEAMIPCPLCGITVKGKNLLRHTILRHSENGA